MSGFRDLVELAHRKEARPPEAGTYLLVSIDEQPSLKMNNRVAALQSEMEDLLLQPIEIVGGGHGSHFGRAEAFCVCLDTGRLTETQASALDEFIATEANADYFRQRYRISGLAVIAA